jgi:hypothetical protein
MDLSVVSVPSISKCLTSVHQTVSTCIVSYKSSKKSILSDVLPLTLLLISNYVNILNFYVATRMGK